jgi:hypothetical protein
VLGGADPYAYLDIFTCYNARELGGNRTFGFLAAADGSEGPGALLADSSGEASQGTRSGGGAPAGGGRRASDPAHPAPATRFPSRAPGRLFYPTVHVHDGTVPAHADFDHTLYDGDSGGHLFKWLILRSWWRIGLALLIAPVFAPMVAFLPTRRVGISGFVWAGTVGLHSRRDLDQEIDRYVVLHTGQIKQRLLPIALDVLHRHREAGDRRPRPVPARPAPGRRARRARLP